MKTQKEREVGDAEGDESMPVMEVEKSYRKEEENKKKRKIVDDKSNLMASKSEAEEDGNEEATMDDNEEMDKEESKDGKKRKVKTADVVMFDEKERKKEKKTKKKKEMREQMMLLDHKDKEVEKKKKKKKKLVGDAEVEPNELRRGDMDADDEGNKGDKAIQEQQMTENDKNGNKKKDTKVGKKKRIGDAVVSGNEGREVEKIKLSDGMKADDKGNKGERKRKRKENETEGDKVLNEEHNTVNDKKGKLKKKEGGKADKKENRRKGKETKDDTVSGHEEQNKEKGKANKTEACKAARKKKVKFADKVTVFQDTDKEKEENCGKWFTKEEDELLKKAVADYIETNQLGEEGVSMVLTCGSHKKIKDCWKHIAAALPWRTVASIYHRGHTLFEQGNRESYTEEQVEFIREFHDKHGADWKTAAEEMGKFRIHVKDAFRRHKLLNRKKGNWSQDEYQKLFDLVNKDMQMKVFEERKSKHGMLKDNISWEAISDKLGTRNNIGCLQKWYGQLTSPMVAQGEWADVDDYWLLMKLVDLDASCEDEVDWDSLLEHRSGDICRKRWLQMALHLGEHGNKSFSEQVEILSNRYCPDLLETREQLDARPYVD